MNVLVFEPRTQLAPFIRSVLRAAGHRVAVSQDPVEAALKLDTGLFDALVFGPAGAPQDLAEHIQAEFPRLPIVLAGVPEGAPASGQVVAVLPAPLSSTSLVKAFRSIGRRWRERLGELPVEVAADGLSIACRLADLSPGMMVIAGESDEFHRHFSGATGRVSARVGDLPVDGEVAGTETDIPRRLRRVNLKLEETSGRELLVRLLK